MTGDCLFFCHSRENGNPIVRANNYLPLQRIDISHLPVGLFFIQIGNYTEKFLLVR
jgi:hypothetical protein